MLAVRFVEPPAYGGRFALLAVVVAIGVPIALRLAASSFRVAALIGLGLAACALGSAAASNNPALSFWGRSSLGTGALFVTALAGSWAIGVSGGKSGRQLVEAGLLFGAIVNAGIALAQLFRDLSPMGFVNLGARPTGAWGQPIMLAPFLVGGLWLVSERFRRAPLQWSIAVILIAAAVQAAGSRSGLALLVVATGLAALRSPRRVGLALLATVALGVMLGSLLTRLDDGATAAERIGENGAQGVNTRLNVWTAGITAGLERPLLGHGPGRFLGAVSPYQSKEVAKTESKDAVFADAHNIFVEHFTTVGVVGLLMLIAFLVAATMHARASPALLGFALLLLASHLVEPQSVGLTPLMFLALGSAAAADLPVPRRVTALITGGSAVAGMGVAAVLFIGLWQQHDSRGRHDINAMLAVDSRLPPWPENLNGPATELRERSSAKPDDPDLLSARSLARDATRRDDEDPGVWSALGYYELAANDDEAAQVAFHRSLAIYPWSLKAMNGLGIAHIRARENAAAAVWFRRSLDLDPTQRLIRDLLELAQHPDQI